MTERHTDAMDFTEFNAKGLRNQCRQRGLLDTGNSPNLITRLVQYEYEAKNGGAQLAEPRTDSLPVQTRHNLPSPTSDRSSISGVVQSSPVEPYRTEQEVRLRHLCHDNHLPPRVRDEAIRQHEAAHKDFNNERDKALLRRNASIKKAETKCAKTIETLIKDRDSKLAESKPQLEKQKIWGTAFYQLNKLMIAAGKPTVHPSEFDPTRNPPAVIPQSNPRSAVFATPPPTAASRWQIDGNHEVYRHRHHLQKAERRRNG